MAVKKKVITRRTFLKDSTAVIAGSSIFMVSDSLGFSEKKESEKKAGAKSKVILVRNKDVLGKNNQLRGDVLIEMIDQAVTTLLGIGQPVEAWKKLFKATDKIGIKTNVWRYLRTPVQLENAIKKRLLDAGLQEENIKIKDRKLYNDKFFQNATALINVRPLRTHHWSGIGSLIKNVITFVSEPYLYHDDSCAMLGKLWKLKGVKNKVRLNILVVLTPQFYSSGPHSFHPKYVWAYKGLLVGFDPVALDATGIRLLQAKRQEYFGEEKPLNPPPKHVYLADKLFKLGNSDERKMDLIKIGWDEDILI